MCTSFRLVLDRADEHCMNANACLASIFIEKVISLMCMCGIFFLILSFSFILSFLEVQFYSLLWCMFSVKCQTDLNIIAFISGALKGRMVKRSMSDSCGPYI